MRFVLLFSFLSLASCAQESSLFSFYGVNSASLFVHTDIKESTFQSLFKDLELEHMRFPGGHESNFYHYKGAGYGYDLDEVKHGHSGHFSTRIDRLQAMIDKQKISRNYIEDYLSLLELQSFETVLVLNILSESDEDILALIDRLQKGGSKVRVVELGNELYNAPYSNVVPSVEVYIEKAKRVANLVRKHYPEMPIVVCAAPNHHLNHKGYERWNHLLSKESFYDGYTVHLYPNLRSFQQRGEDGFRLAADSLLKYCKVEVPNQLDSYRQVFGNDKQLWITEWNLAVSEQYGNTSLQMLFVATFYMEMRNYSKSHPIYGMTFHNLGEKEYVFSMINKAWEGEEELFGKEYMPRMSYFAHQALRQVKELELEKRSVNSQICLYSNELVCFAINWSGEWRSLKEIGIKEKNRLYTVNGEKLFASNGVSRKSRKDFRFVEKDYTQSRKEQPLFNKLAPYSITLFNLEERSE